jgi:PAS domain S-box-containing protein
MSEWTWTRSMRASKSHSQFEHVEPHFTDSRLHAAFWDESPIPHAIVSTKGTFLRVNEAWAHMLGYAKAELLGSHFGKITHPSDIDGDQGEVNRLLTDPTATGYSMVKRYLSKQGASVWVELHVVAIRDSEQTLECFAVVVVPIPSPNPGNAGNARSNLTRLIDCYINLLTNRPRECLAALVIGVVAVGAIPIGSVIEVIKAYFNL